MGDPPVNAAAGVPSAAGPSATKVRYGVLGFVCALSTITYLDRVAFGAAASSIKDALGLGSIADLKFAFTAFAFAYAAFEIPSGWLGDVYGPRKTLIRIVLWWSVFTALTGAVGLEVRGVVLGGLVTLVVIRFLFGMGEAGAYPNITRALHNWLPFSERGLGQGAVWMAGRLMGGLTPLVWLVLVNQLELSWRAAFCFFGVLGVLWCIAFAAWFRNRPEEKRSVSPSELDHIRAGRSPGEEGAHAGVPWLRLLADGNLWRLCLMYFCGAYGWYFNITYLHTFLEEQYDVPASSVVGALYKGGPLWMGAVACLVGGLLTDRFIRRTGDRKWGRRLFGIIGHSSCALAWACSVFAPNAFLFFLFVSLAAFCNDLTMGSAWAVCQDIGKRYAAIVAGCMNTVGNMGGAVAGYVTGQILEMSLSHYMAVHDPAGYAADPDKAVKALTAAEKAAALLPGYHLNLWSFAAVYVVAALLWLGIDATRPVAQGTEKP